MSQENVALARGVYEDFKAGRTEFDAEGTITRMAGEELWDQDIEWDASGAVVPDLTGIYRGKDAVRQWWREWLAAWETVDFEYQLLDAGDRVVALIDQRMRGRSTGIEVKLGKYAHVATFRDGLIVHWKVYLSQSDALEAAGLRD
jgi:ketosteroid isomerase-like protein